MAVRIEKGGWILIFLIGLGLVGYSLYRYGVWDLLVPAAKVRQSTVPPRADLPPPATSAPVAPGTPGATPVALPGAKPGCADRP